ncbi:MAG: universal stress protein [Rhodospirillales bacterium]|nr:universal stress protein [Rhodospirillales bacterium]
MIKTILVPTDGSEHAAKAVGFAADLAAKYGAKIHLLHVLHDLGTGNIPPELRSYARLEHVEMTERDVVKSLANEILYQAAQRARQQGADRIETTVQVGDPAREILAQAEQTEADLIVMGTRGLSDLQGLLMGSIAHKVSHLAPCSCITVR